MESSRISRDEKRATKLHSEIFIKCHPYSVLVRVRSTSVYMKQFR